MPAVENTGQVLRWVLFALLRRLCQYLLLLDVLDKLQHRASRVTIDEEVSSHLDPLQQHRVVLFLYNVKRREEQVVRLIVRLSITNASHFMKCNVASVLKNVTNYNYIEYNKTNPTLPVSAQKHACFTQLSPSRNMPSFHWTKQFGGTFLCGTVEKWTPFQLKYSWRSILQASRLELAWAMIVHLCTRLDSTFNFTSYGVESFACHILLKSSLVKLFS